MKPRIIIPLAISNTPAQSPRYFARVAYAEAIEKHGGIPIFVSRPSDEDLEELLSTMDGLLIMGGVDPHPRHYNEEVLPACGEIDDDRDRIEIKLLDLAEKNNVPFLGLCRGIQIFNVHRGGSLYQDIPTQLPSEVIHKADEVTGRKDLVHSVTLSPDSKLGKILGADTFKVNSLHHQGIKMLGKGLIATATSEDGLIEAVEGDSDSYRIAVEWHPEELSDKASGRLLDSFINACKHRAR